MVVIYLVLLYCCWWGNQHFSYVVLSVTEHKRILHVHIFLIMTFFQLQQFNRGKKWLQ